MRALSIHPHWLAMILSGQKTLEIRSRKTLHRGDLLLCATRRVDARPYPGIIPGHAACMVDLVDCRLTTPDDAGAACTVCDPGTWAWVLANIRRVVPVLVVGQQSFFDVADHLIRICPIRPSRPHAESPGVLWPPWADVAESSR